MRLLIGAIAVIIALPVALLVAVALGPVIVGVLLGLGCGFVVFVIGNILVGIGLLGRSAEQAGERRLSRGRLP